MDDITNLQTRLEDLESLVSRTVLQSTEVDQEMRALEKEHADQLRRITLLERDLDTKRRRNEKGPAKMEMLAKVKDNARADLALLSQTAKDLLEQEVQTRMELSKLQKELTTEHQRRASLENEVHRVEAKIYDTWSDTSSNRWLTPDATGQVDELPIIPPEINLVPAGHESPMEADSLHTCDHSLAASSMRLNNSSPKKDIAAKLLVDPPIARSPSPCQHHDFQSLRNGVNTQPSTSNSPNARSVSPLQQESLRHAMNVEPIVTDATTARSVSPHQRGEDLRTKMKTKPFTTIQPENVEEVPTRPVAASLAGGVEMDSPAIGQGKLEDALITLPVNSQTASPDLIKMPVFAEPASVTQGMSVASADPKKYCGSDCNVTSPTSVETSVSPQREVSLVTPTTVALTTSPQDLEDSEYLKMDDVTVPVADLMISTCAASTKNVDTANSLMDSCEESLESPESLASSRSPKKSRSRKDKWADEIRKARWAREAKEAP
eukprot:gnl/MRDRNA2_/MRDRNA2_43972_c0_seq2.p1 gnl/MRDRNA2_/MRDRNA2_43972_c0~~gnl/MRDRNA2_/MRDRNA2_43972_c0_seq2.p1  ORF type:complete len:510 (-),score=102.56 gnl/MRDRNA2_/MRDRNA2_43972_c0_seq2:111-1589(-)